MHLPFASEFEKCHSKKKTTTYKETKGQASEEAELKKLGKAEKAAAKKPASKRTVATKTAANRTNRKSAAA